MFVGHTFASWNVYSVTNPLKYWGRIIIMVENGSKVSLLGVEYKGLLLIIKMLGEDYWVRC